MSHSRALTTPLPSVPVVPVSSLEPSQFGSLSKELRAATQGAHQDVERRLALPGSITSLLEYKQCLLRFYQLYLPLERLLMAFPDWLIMGFAIPEPCRSRWLSADLRALGVRAGDLPMATETHIPSLPDFAHAVGALYVLEGSALGSQYILPPLQKLLGEQIAGAEAFFTGRGQATSSFWSGFRAQLDEFGAVHPDQTLSVVWGAIATFQSIGTWMRP